MRGFLRNAGLVAVGVLSSSCRQDMHDQPRFEPMEENTFFADGRSARPLVEGTVARGRLFEDVLLHTGRVDGELSRVFPFRVTADVLARGRERYDIYCAVCHDRAGTGLGMIVKRGLRRPPSFHIERLRDAPPGYFFDVMTVGFGAMFDYADRIKPEDRWAITGYIRALQLSQDALLADVPEGRRAELLEGS